MDNQHRLINGYRDLTQEEIDLMNEIKAVGAKLDELCDKVFASVQSEQEKAMMIGSGTWEAFDLANPMIWLYDARSTLQKGLMFLTRAVARPSSF